MKSTRQYRPEDCERVTRLIVQLQEYIAALDPLCRQKTGRDFDAAAYMERTLKRVEEERGVIFVAEAEGVIEGCIIGCIPEPSEEDLLESYPVKEGSIMDLIVSEESRGSGLGSELMQTIEEYFRKEGCEFVRVDCFGPNAGAHEFYRTSGYEDRNFNMMRKLK